MTSLYEYKVLVDKVFYKCWHILEYIEKHPNMYELDRKAIEATIMDALVYNRQIDPNTQSLDLDNLRIVNNLDYYTYEKYPNICGIPLWMKEEFRKKCLQITGGIPISMFLCKPPSKITRYCVYDPNTAVSAIFDDFTFYNATYISPTRNKRIESVRPFVEVMIGEEYYLVDVLTKRILKSSWFKSNYDFEIIEQVSINTMDKEKLSYYMESISNYNGLGTTLSLLLPIIEYNTSPNMAEMKYEIKMSKKYFPEEWIKYKKYDEEFELYIKNSKSKKLR